MCDSEHTIHIFQRAAGYEALSAFLSSLSLFKCPDTKRWAPRVDRDTDKHRTRSARLDHLLTMWRLGFHSEMAAYNALFKSLELPAIIID